MSSKSNAEFLKKYVSSLKNVSDKGVWSGRGIGIPVAGAVDGSADGSKYLGRPRRQRQQGDQGSPSQSADSAFSSYLSRVNKDYSMEGERYPMFPDQEEGYYDELEYIYKLYDVEPLVTSKLQKPKGSKISSKIMNHNRPSLRESLDLELANAFGDSIRQTASAADGIDWIILIPSLLKNYIEIKTELSKAEEVINEFEASPSDDLAEELETISLSLAIDVMDILQIISEAIIPSLAGTAASASLERGLHGLGKTKDLLRGILTGGGIVGGAARDMGWRSIIRSNASSLNRLLQKTPGFARYFIGFFIDAVETIAEIEEKIEKYDAGEEWEQTGGSRVGTAFAGLPDSEDTIQNITQKIMSLSPGAKKALASAGGVAALVGLTKASEHSPRGALEIMIDQLTESTEEDNLRLLVKDVLKEYTINQPRSLHPSAPTEFQFYSPPVAEEEDDAEDDKTYDEYSVIVPGDEGVSTYSVRPTNESELRDMIKNILSETKKKVKRKSPRSA